MSARPALAEAELDDAPQTGAAEPVRAAEQVAGAAKPKAAIHTLAKTSRRGSSRGKQQTVVEPNWKLMAPVFALAALFAGVLTFSVPGTATMLELAAAIAIAALTPKAVALEKKRLHNANHRTLLATALCGLPMLLFGIGVGGWTEASATRWQESMGILVIVGALAAVILNRKVEIGRASCRERVCLAV